MVNPGKSDVLLDLCTQRDYLYHAGARTVLNAPTAMTHIKRLMTWARWAKVPVLSCVDVTRNEEALGSENPACVVGTWGQRKVGCTLLPDRVSIESDNCLCVSLDILQKHQQAILIKRHRDPFTNPKLDRLLTEMPARRFVIFGVSLDSSIRQLVLGLLLRGRRAMVLGDACGYWNQNEADFCLRQLDAKGCAIATTSAFIQESRQGRAFMQHANGRRVRGRVA